MATNKKDEDDPKRVKLTKTAFDTRSAFKKRTKEVEVPELNEFMGVTDGVVIVVIQQMDLDSYLISNSDIVDQQTNLVEGVVQAASDKGLVRAEALKMLNKSSVMLRQRLKIVEKGLVTPKLLASDLLWIANMFPFVISRVANEILELTEKGAVKKNSQDLK